MIFLQSSNQIKWKDRQTLWIMKRNCFDSKAVFQCQTLTKSRIRIHCRLVNITFLRVVEPHMKFESISCTESQKFYEHTQLQGQSKSFSLSLLIKFVVLQPVWQHTPTIPPLERLSQEDCQESEVSLGYTMSLN